jgi:hypothetical protein
MKRLTARTKNGHAYLVNVKPDEQEVDSPYKNTLQCILDCFERLAQYEDAEEQGRCVLMPCKVGDTVYLVLPKCRASRIPLAECSFFECDDCPRNKREVFEQKATIEMLSMMLFEKYNTLYVFGKTVFLTRAEAEAALAKEGASND